MAYTLDEQAQLDKLYSDLQKAQATYNYEANMNQVGHEYQQKGYFYFPYSGQFAGETSFYNWLASSDAAASAASAALKAATKAYNDYKQLLTDKYVTNNTTVQTAVQSAKVAAEAQAQADIAKNAENKKYFQKTTKYIIIGAIVLTLIAVGVWYYRKKFAN